MEKENNENYTLFKNNTVPWALPRIKSLSKFISNLKRRSFIDFPQKLKPRCIFIVHIYLKIWRNMKNNEDRYKRNNNLSDIEQI